MWWTVEAILSSRLLTGALIGLQASLKHLKYLWCYHLLECKLTGLGVVSQNCIQQNMMGTGVGPCSFTHFYPFYVVFSLLLDRAQMSSK